MSKLLDSGQLEWAWLGERLRVASPDRFQQSLEVIREMVDAAEIVAGKDHQLFLRSERPTKIYVA